MKKEISQSRLQDWEHWLCKKFKTYDYAPD
jgi:hypothetical protein